MAFLLFKRDTLYFIQCRCYFLNTFCCNACSRMFFGLSELRSFANKGIWCVHCSADISTARRHVGRESLAKVESRPLLWTSRVSCKNGASVTFEEVASHLQSLSHGHFCGCHELVAKLESRPHLWRLRVSCKAGVTVTLAEVASQLHNWSYDHFLVSWQVRAHCFLLCIYCVRNCTT